MPLANRRPDMGKGAGPRARSLASEATGHGDAD